MALTANNINCERSNEVAAIPVQAVVTAATSIWQNSLVGRHASGTAVPATTTLPILGIADEARTGGQSLRMTINVCATFTLTGVTAADVGKAAYAVDDNTLTLTPNTAVVGPIIGVPATNTALVWMTTRA